LYFENNLLKKGVTFLEYHELYILEVQLNLHLITEMPLKRKTRPLCLH